MELTLTTLSHALLLLYQYVVTTLTQHATQASMVVVSALFMLPTAVIFPRMFARANIPPQSFTLARVRALNRLRAARKQQQQQQQYSTYNRAAPAVVARTARVQQATVYYGADISDDVYKRGSDMSSHRISPVAAMTPSPTTNGRKQSFVAWGAPLQDTTAIEVRHAEQLVGRNNVLKKEVHGWTDTPEAALNLQECNIWKDLVRLQLLVIKLTSILILTGSLVTGKQQHNRVM
jgi:hypothetical protein